MRLLQFLLLAAGIAGTAQADEIELTALRTGGFYASGAFDNDAAFQNYFVGYGTTPGSPRTPERRSFFVFELPALPAGMRFETARLELRLPFGGLIFGKGPGDPETDPILPDASESFGVGLLDLPMALVLDPGLTAAMAMAIFDAIDATPVAAPTVFDGAPLPDPGDGGPPIVPVMLDEGGLAALDAKAGATVILGGWMPSWSEDLRLSPAPPPMYFESSELIFGFTDVHHLPILAPVLVVTIGVVPEPPAALLAALGLAGLALRRCRRGAGPQSAAWDRSPTSPASPSATAR